MITALKTKKMKKYTILGVLACTLTGFVAQGTPGSFTALLVSAKTLTTQYGTGVAAQGQPKIIQIICADGTVVVPKDIVATLDYFKAQDNFQKHSKDNQNTVNVNKPLEEIANGISTQECQYLFNYIKTRNIHVVPDESLVAVFCAADYLGIPQKLIQALAQRCLDRCDITATNHPGLHNALTTHTVPAASRTTISENGTLDMSNQGLTNLDALVNYTLLNDKVTTLNLSDNALTELDIQSILTLFPKLTKINARNNMLPNTSDIKAIKNKEGPSIQLHGNPIPSDEVENTKKLLRPTRWQKNRDSITKNINKAHMRIFFYLGTASTVIWGLDWLIRTIIDQEKLDHITCITLPVSLISILGMTYSDNHNYKIVPTLKPFMPTKIMHDKKVSMNDLD